MVPVDRPGSVTIQPTGAPKVGIALTATLSDPDGGVTGVTWAWALGGTILAGATSNTYTPAAADIGKTLIVTVNYTDSKDGPDIATRNAGVVVSEDPPVSEDPNDVDGDGDVDVDDVIMVARQLAAGTASIGDLLAVAGAMIDAINAAPPGVSAELHDVLTPQHVKELIAHAVMAGATRDDIQVLEGLLARVTPDQTELLANYPNPFNPETWIPYTLVADTEVRITIYAANGVPVRTLHVGPQPAGIYTSRGRAAYWDGRNDRGESVGSGVYFCELRTPSSVQVRRMAIVK